jgi:hypothetical protein
MSDADRRKKRRTFNPRLEIEIIRKVFQSGMIGKAELISALQAEHVNTVGFKQAVVHLAKDGVIDMIRSLRRCRFFTPNGQARCVPEKYSNPNTYMQARVDRFNEEVEKRREREVQYA